MKATLCQSPSTVNKPEQEPLASGAIKCAGGMNFLLTTEDTVSTEVTFFTLTYCNSL